MGANRFHFADDDKYDKPEPKDWLTRAIIVSVLVGIGSAAHLMLGIRFF